MKQVFDGVGMYKKEEKIGETIINKYGFKTTIIGWEDAHHIDVKFETGGTVYNCTYHDFLVSNVKNPDLPRGMTKSEYEKYFINGILNKNGWKMKILKYYDDMNIDIVFDECNAIVHTEMKLFKNGEVKHPNRHRITPEEYQRRLNLKVVKNNGYYMQILNYRSATDIDVYFNGDKNNVKRHQRFTNFERGLIGNPEDMRSSCLPVDAAINGIYGGYIRNANRRKIQFNLTREELMNIISQPCYLCGDIASNEKTTKRIQYKYNGIDRIDSNKGYSVDNCRPCCRMCNTMKNKYDFDEFLDHINKILKHNAMCA